MNLTRCDIDVSRKGETKLSTFTDRHASNLALLLTSKRKQVREQLPHLADAYDKRITDDLIAPATRALDRIDDIRTSNRYTNTREELRLYAHSFSDERLAKLRADTVTKLEAQRQAREAAIRAPKKTTGDPATALVQELQRQEIRRELRTLDPLTLTVRLKQSAGTPAGDVLLDAIESDPIAAAGGAPIVGADVLRETREAAALAADPQLGELAQLRDAYQFAIGAVEQTLLDATGLSKAEVATPPTETVAT
jgi:hypothetical protein